MRHLKTYENYEEVKKSLSELSDKLKTLKLLSQLQYRKNTPQEIIDDYFLEFKESERFMIRAYRNSAEGIGPIHLQLNNIVNSSNIESEFKRYVSKLKSIKDRLEDMLFNCHFVIKLNSKPQADLNPITHRYDDYKFKGLGDNNSGYDGKEVYHTNDYINKWDEERGSKVKSKPDEVSVEIHFYII